MFFKKEAEGGGGGGGGGWGVGGWVVRGWHSKNRADVEEEVQMICTITDTLKKTENWFSRPIIA